MIVKGDLLKTQSPVSFPVPSKLIVLVFMNCILEAKCYASGANRTQNHPIKPD